MTPRYSKWKTIWNIPRLLKSSWRLLQNPQVPSFQKLLITVIGLGYLLWPLDLIPDIPLLGQIDDLGVIFLLLNWFVNRSEPQDTINADYYFHDDEENKNE